MECNKTAGSNGLPAQFNKVFWKDICDHSIDSYNYAHLYGHLSVSQTRGIIKLIPKKDSNSFSSKIGGQYVLNCNHKIIAKAIAC